MYKKICKAEASRYTWGNNCDSWVFLDKEHLSIKLENMPPNTREEAHHHAQASQFFYLIKGKAIFHINEEEVNISSQEGIFIPPLTVHYIENRSNETIDFLVISNPSTNSDRVND